MTAGGDVALQPDGYRDVQSRGRGEQVAPASFSDLAIPVGEILG